MKLLEKGMTGMTTMWSNLKTKILAKTSAEVAATDLLVADTTVAAQLGQSVSDSSTVVNNTVDSVVTTVDTATAVTAAPVSTTAPVVITSDDMMAPSSVVRLAESTDTHGVAVSHGLLPNLADAPILNYALGGFALMANLVWFSETQDAQDAEAAKPAAASATAEVINLETVLASDSQTIVSEADLSTLTLSNLIGDNSVYLAVDINGPSINTIDSSLVIL